MRVDWRGQSESSLRITFYRTTPDGQTVVGHAELQNGRVELIGLGERLRRTLEHKGICVFGQHLTPADGEAFLRHLPFAYNGTYLRAAPEE